VDQELLVDDRIDDGEKLLTHLVRSGFDVTVAFWVLTSEGNSWSLYIGSNAVVPGRVGDAYRMLYTCLTKIPDASVSFSEVKLVDLSNPIAKDALAERDRQLARMHRARLPVRYYGKRLGNLAIEEAYIYPPTGPMTRDEVRQTVMALLTRSGPARPSTFTLADGSIIKQAIPIGMHLNLAGLTRGLQFELLDPTTNQSQVVAADEVINIQ
jgi:hypothetical protein